MTRALQRVIVTEDRGLWRRRLLWTLAGGLMSVLLACGTSRSAPEPTPHVIVVTATPAPVSSTPTRGDAVASSSSQATASPAPAPATSGPLATSASGQPAGTSTVPSTASSGPRVTATPGSGTATAVATPAEQRLAVERGNSYRGLQFTVGEAREGAAVESKRAPSGKTLVGVRLRVHNPSQKVITFGYRDQPRLSDAIRLQLPSGGNPTAMQVEPFGDLYVDLPPQETREGWAYFALDRVVPLEALKLSLGSGNESPAVIPFSGPQEVVEPRTWEVARSTDVFRGVIWSVSGGTIRADIPGQQANPGQEFVVLKVRATNPSPLLVKMEGPRPGWGNNLFAQEAVEYLRLEADNGVLLQPSAALDALPTEFQARAERDALYAWQLPRGSQNPSLVILAPDGSEARLPIGPLPPL